MSIPGIEIHRAYDEYGIIRVFEDGPMRYLSFGEDAQQSCINMQEPGKLSFAYTQAMMLALLYQTKPEHATVLGLGAGSLVHALHRYDKTILISAVELRPEVAKVAQEFFHLAPQPKLEIHIDDAAHYMQSCQTQSDLIFSDIYNDDGMTESQLSAEFISACYQRLSAKGMLILNVWDEGKGSHPKAMQILHEHFGDNCVVCPIYGGNLIVYGFKGGVPNINSRRLQPVAKRLSKKLDFSVQSLLQAFKTA